MANKNPKNLIKDDSVEDVTQYGELIPSFDQWTTYENQDRVVQHLENCTRPGYKEKVPRSERK